MSGYYEKCKVISNKETVTGIYRLHITGDFEGKPGQFYMLRASSGEALLPRPISIHFIDKKGVNFLYQIKGKGTRYFSELKKGDTIDLLGPLGNGFDIDSISGRIAIVSGGIGIAPMTYLIKQLKNCKIDLYCGFRNDVFGLKDIISNLNKINIATDTGAFGYKGVITDIFKPDNYDMVLCCGPEVMMSKVVQMCKESSVPVYVSMEKYMACGLGACLVCTCKTIYGNKRSCSEGPVFLGEELI